MNKLLLYFSVFLLLGACKTQKTTLDQNQSAETVLEKSLLWKIEGNGLENPSYLFGTIHLITKEDFFWPEGTLGAFEQSDRIVFEIDMDDMFDMSKQMSLMTKAFMKDGKSLKDFYTDEEYALVSGHFEGMGLPMFFLEKLKPMFLTVFASGDVDIGAGLGGDSNMKSYEMELFELSQQSGKEVQGLESIEFQMSVFDSIPYQVQADMLLETIRSTDVEDDSFRSMIEMYRLQDINKMISTMSEDESISDYEDLLLNSRNEKWIPVMSEKMQEGTTFFAVGAGHLGGKDGVVNLLKLKGYELKPLSQTE